MKFTCTITLLVAAFALASAAPQPNFASWLNQVSENANKFIQAGWERQNEAFKELEQAFKGGEQVGDLEKADIDEIAKQVEEDVKVIWDQGVESVEEAGKDTEQIIDDVVEDLKDDVEHPKEIKDEFKEDVDKIVEQIKEDTKIIMEQGKESREEGEQDFEQIVEDLKADAEQIKNQVEADLEAEAASENTN